MPTATRHRILPIDQLNSEWRILGRSEHAFALASLIAVLGLVIGNCVLLYFGSKSAAAS